MVYDTRAVQLAPKAATSLCPTAVDIVKPLAPGTSLIWVRYRFRNTYMSLNELAVVLLTSVEVEIYPQRRQSREKCHSIIKTSQPNVHLKGIETAMLNRLESLHLIRASPVQALHKVLATCFVPSVESFVQNLRAPFYFNILLCQGEDFINARASPALSLAFPRSRP